MPVAAPPIVQPRPIIQQPARLQPPIVIVAPPQTEPSLEIVIQPPIQEQRTYEHPTRSPERYPEEVRNEPQPKTRHDPETVAPVRPSPVVESNQPDNLETQPVQKKISPDTQQKELTPVQEKINEPLKFSPPEQAPQASPRKRLQHKKRNPGRQRKYHQTIALLEDMHDGDTNQFDKLDGQMQRYYKREYAEYFGRESKRSAEQRLTNRTKAARTKRDSERRRIAEISRGIQSSSAV